LGKKIRRRCHVLTDGKLDDIGARLEHLPRTHRQIYPHTDILVSSVRISNKVAETSFVSNNTNAFIATKRFS
jgi:hypothetical protein